jgi:hypothetical protein
MFLQGLKKYDTFLFFYIIICNLNKWKYFYNIYNDYEIIPSSNYRYVIVFIITYNIDFIVDDIVENKNFG